MNVTIKDERKISVQAGDLVKISGRMYLVIEVQDDKMYQLRNFNGTGCYGFHKTMEQLVSTIQNANGIVFSQNDFELQLVAR